MNITINAITPTGTKTAYNHDFNPFPAPLYIVDMDVNGLHFQSNQLTEVQIREGLKVSYDDFRAFVDEE